MRHFVHLKDDVVFAYHQSSTEVDIPGDNIIQVDHDGSGYLLKKYVNGEFVEAPQITYAVLDQSNDNTVIGIEKTLFASEVAGPIINNSDVTFLWKWNGENFVPPQAPDVIPTINVGNTSVTTSDVAPAITEEQLQAQAAAAAAAEEAANNPVEQPSQES